MTALDAPVYVALAALGALTLVELLAHARRRCWLGHRPPAQVVRVPSWGYECQRCHDVVRPGRRA